jgi:hypothetical protein
VSRPPPLRIGQRPEEPGEPGGVRWVYSERLSDPYATRPFINEISLRPWGPIHAVQSEEQEYYEEREQLMICSPERNERRWARRLIEMGNLSVYVAVYVRVRNRERKSAR